MLLTTTDTLPENLYVIERILGPVHGETIFGTHFGKDFLASFTNAFEVGLMKMSLQKHEQKQKKSSLNVQVKWVLMLS